MSCFELRRVAIAALVLVSSTGLSACMNLKSYVDPALVPVAKSQLPTVATPKPVSVLFEFRTKGNANPQATSALQGRVIAATAESDMFSKVSSTAGIPDAGILKIIIDNVGDQGSAVAKGIGTGLTLGLAGSLVRDGYACTASYAYKEKTYETTLNHAILTTVGNHRAPPGLTAVTPMDAINQVVDQLVWHALKDLAEKQAFRAE